MERQNSKGRSKLPLVGFVTLHIVTSLTDTWILLHVTQIWIEVILTILKDHLYWVIVGNESKKELIYVWDSLCFPPEINTTLQINYTAIKRKFPGSNTWICITEHLKIEQHFYSTMLRYRIIFLKNEHLQTKHIGVQKIVMWLSY